MNPQDQELICNMAATLMTRLISDGSGTTPTNIKMCVETAVKLYLEVKKQTALIV